MTDRETAELPAERRDPTLPLPREGGVSARTGWWRRGPEQRPPWWLVAVVLVAVAAAGFSVGWAVRGGPPRRAAAQGEAPLPTRDAEYCGRALDVAARVIQVYREAMENRVAFIDALLEKDAERMNELQVQLPALTLRADRLEVRVTRALSTCPS